MNKITEIDEIAQGIADITQELMRDTIDWQLADQKVSGNKYEELCDYTMRKAIEFMNRQVNTVSMEKELYDNLEIEEEE
jgi:hypothetical protein